MDRDTLFLIEPGFADPAYPGKTFYCWHCALMEGVLASFPELTKGLAVKRIPFARPRKEIVDLIGAENDSLPLLVLASNAPPGITAHAPSAPRQCHRGRRTRRARSIEAQAIRPRAATPDLSECHRRGLARG